MSQDLLALLDNPELDLHPPPFDQEFCWREDPPAAAVPAPRLSLVPSLKGAIHPYSPQAVDGQAVIDSLRSSGEPGVRTLRGGIEAIAELTEEIDAVEQDEELSAEQREAATKLLIAALLPELAGTKKKVDGTNAVLAMYEHLVAAGKGERDRLTKRIRRFERCIERLESYVLATLEASKLQQLEGETSTLRRQLNPASVAFVDGIDFENDLDDEFLRWTCEPKKNEIKAAIKAKREVPGASLVRLARLVRS